MKKEELILEPMRLRAHYEEKQLEFLKIINELADKVNDMKIDGRVDDAEVSYKRITRIKPVAHHYENEGEDEYIKWGCPICESFNNRHSFAEGTENCPLCNVNLLWGFSR